MKEVYEIIAKIMNTDVSKINENSCAENIPEWDSMNNLIVFSELGKKFNVSFSMNEINSMKNVGDIIKAINTKRK